MTQLEQLTAIISQARREMRGAYASAGDIDRAIAERLVEKGAVLLPCKVGDYIEWDNGVCKSLHRVNGFMCRDDLGLRYDLDICSPIVSHHAIARVIPREAAEKALEERSDR